MTVIRPFVYVIEDNGQLFAEELQTLSMSILQKGMPNRNVLWNYCFTLKKLQFEVAHASYVAGEGCSSK